MEQKSIIIRATWSYSSQFFNKSPLHIENWHNLLSCWENEVSIGTQDHQFTVRVVGEWDEAMGQDHVEMDSPDVIKFIFTSKFQVSQSTYQKMVKVNKILQEHRKNYRVFPADFNYRKFGKKVAFSLEAAFKIVFENLIIRFWQFDFYKLHLKFDSRFQSLGGWFDGWGTYWRESPDSPWKKFMPTSLHYNYEKRTKCPAHRNYFESGLIEVDNIEEIQKYWTNGEQLSSNHKKLYYILLKLKEQDFFEVLIHLVALIEIIFAQEIYKSFISRNFSREYSYFEKLNVSAKAIILLKIKNHMEESEIQSIVNLVDIRNKIVHENVKFKTTPENLSSISSGIKLVYDYLQNAPPLPIFIINNIRII